jgi:hypothetical protein
MVIGMRLSLLFAMSTVALVAWHASQLGTSTQSSWTTSLTLTIHDAAALRNAWSQMYPVAAQRPALPAVSFDKYRVVIVAAGTRPTGGYRLALSESHIARDSALISVTMFTPAPGCGVTQEITTPAIAVAMPSSPKSFRIILQERADTVRCH